MANEHSQIVPSMQPTATVADFKFWCQKVLPLVYDDSLSYYEVLNKMVIYLNQVIDNINADIENVEELEDDFLLLQDYVNNFFDDIDQLASYAERAEAAETSAIGYAASAAESASNSATSASNAAGSASTAASMATNALNAKDAAVAAKTAAETALANAQTAATNAANSATAASGSATAASGSATNAAASATAAQQSFTLADAARSAAQSSANDASGSATAAAASAVEAEAAASSADGAKAQSMIANEDSSTAEYAHTVGSYFRMNGVLYEATENIAIGDTITVGTNCKTAVVCDDIYAIKNNLLINTAYDTVNGTQILIKNAIVNSKLNIKNITQATTSKQNLTAEIFYNNLVDSENMFIANTDLTSSGGTIAANNRWVTDFIDVSNYDTVYLQMTYFWSSSYRNRVWTYDENKDPIAELYSNATNARNNTYLTLEVTDAHYIRFGVPSYVNPVTNENSVIVLSVEPKVASTVELTDFYGGIIDFYNGKVTSMYDSSGEALPTPVITTFTPFAPNAKEYNLVYTRFYNTASPSNSTECTFEISANELVGITEKMITKNKLNTFVADKSYTVNDIIMVLNTLYIVTSPITMGETILIDTNVTETTIGELITQILNA